MFTSYAVIRFSSAFLLNGKAFSAEVELVQGLVDFGIVQGPVARRHDDPAGVIAAGIRREAVARYPGMLLHGAVSVDEYQVHRGCDRYDLSARSAVHKVPIDDVCIGGGR